jgi:hypothetical protein
VHSFIAKKLENGVVRENRLFQGFTVVFRRKAKLCKE